MITADSMPVACVCDVTSFVIMQCHLSFWTILKSFVHTYITIFHTLTLTTPPPQKYYVTPSHIPTHPHMNNILSQEPPSTPPCAWENLLPIQGPTQPHCKHSQYKLSLWKSIALYSCVQLSRRGTVHVEWRLQCYGTTSKVRYTWNSRASTEWQSNVLQFQGIQSLTGWHLQPGPCHLSSVSPAQIWMTQDGSPKLHMYTWL